MNSVHHASYFEWLSVTGNIDAELARISESIWKINVENINKLNSNVSENMDILKNNRMNIIKNLLDIITAELDSIQKELTIIASTDQPTYKKSLHNKHYFLLNLKIKYIKKERGTFKDDIADAILEKKHRLPLGERNFEKIEIHH